MGLDEVRVLGSSGGTHVFLHGPGLLVVGLESLQRSDFYDIDRNDKDERKIGRGGVSTRAWMAWLAASWGLLAAQRVP